MASKKSSSGPRRRAALKRRIAALEKQWAAGLRAPSEALQLCLEGGMPEHEWPAFIRGGTLLFSSVTTDSKPPLIETSKPLTGPGRTHVLATMADKLLSNKVSAPAAARAAVEAMRARGWEHGDKVVARVKREMSKLAKNMQERALHYSPAWDRDARDQLAKQGKTRR